MPRFLCYCPDYPNSLQKRLSVRPEHLVAAKADLESGLQSTYTDRASGLDQNGIGLTSGSHGLAILTAP